MLARLWREEPLGYHFVIASTPPQSNWGDLRKKQGFGMESGELVF